MDTQASDLEWRLRRIEKTIPYLFRMHTACHDGGCLDCGGGDLRGPHENSQPSLPKQPIVKSLSHSSRLLC